VTPGLGPGLTASPTVDASSGSPAHWAVRRARERGLSGARRGALVGLVVAFLMVLTVVPTSAGSSGPGINGAGDVARVLGPSGVAGSVPSGSLRPDPSVGDSGIPGQDPDGESAIDSVQLAEQMQSAPGTQTRFAAAANETRSPLPPTSRSGGRAGSVGLPTSGPALDYGWVVGSVVSALSPQTPLSGAVVNAEPLVGFCPPAGCTPVETGAHGQFTVAASVGENEVTVSSAYYLSNRTWVYVSAGADVSVGTVGLVPDALVSGVVLGDDAAHEPVAGVSISSASRDGSVTGSPSTHTNNEGQFTVAVPPVPSMISFTPLDGFAPYEPNTTFVNASSGQSVNIGTIYLPRMTGVELSIVDAETGAPISGTTASIAVCSRATGYCPAQGATVGGPLLVAQAPVGPDVVHVYAAGFVLDTTVLGVVPSTLPGTRPIDMGTVALVPTGAIQLWVNITGVPAPYGATVPTSVWPVGEFAVVTSCNLDGLRYTYLDAATGNMSSFGCTSECVAPGHAATIQGIPLRDYVTVVPDETGCLVAGDPTWPIPGDLPVFGNYGWVNVTPGRLLNAGGIDLLPGSYIEGQVLPASESGWDVTACSTDETSICGEPSVADSEYNGSSTFSAPNRCPQPGGLGAATTYCVAAPPGPVEIRVTPSNASANYTWAFNPSLTWSSLPLPLASADQDQSNVINLVSASVSGRVLEAGDLAFVPGLVSIQVCPAGASPGAVVCGSGVANVTGFFEASAPIGWDEVTVSAANFESNSTWLYVARDNSTGAILLEPFGSVSGRVLNVDGDGLYEATVQRCALANPSACQPVGTDGLTSSDGAYYGAVPAGPTPVGTYQIEASAPGYVTDWTWVNVTSPGGNFTAPEITLVPSVATSFGAAAEIRRATTPFATSTGPSGAWVVGRVIDTVYAIGLPNVQLSAEPFSGGAPVSLSSPLGDGGEFNDSLPPGDYTITASVPGYYPSSLLLNVSGNVGIVNLGTISLVPFPTVTGRLVIDPESWRVGVSDSLGLGPGQGSIEVCTNEATVCGPAGVVATSGEFNVSAPAGTSDLVEADGTGNGPGTAPEGFVQNRTYVNVTNGTLSAAFRADVGLSIFGIITGSVINANATSGPDLPVRYDQITADTTFPFDATQSEALTADGTYAMIFPESKGLNMTAGGAGSWIPLGVGITVNGTHEGGSGNYTLSAGGTANLAPIALEHYGWVDAEVGNARALAGVPFATIAATEVGTLWNLQTTFAGTGVANGAGFINISAPPSIPSGEPRVMLNVSAPDFTSTLIAVTVNASATSYVNGTGPSHLGRIGLEPWGWISTRVADSLTGRLLPGVLVSVSSGGVPVGKQEVTTNGIGEYFVDAPPTTADIVSLALDGYVANRTTYSVSSGEHLSPSLARLTGDGIVAGRVLSYPTGLPVSGAIVAVCPTVQPNCDTSATTNASGVFWITAAPGPSVIIASDAGYVSNSPAFVDTVSDQWVWGGTISLGQYAQVSGMILGLPSGLPLDLGTASLCAPSPSGIGAGPCFVTVPSGPDGSFQLLSPAGDFVLDVRAADYNDTFLTVALLPGEALSVGVIFVQQYGSAAGAIYSAGTSLPVPGASIVACQAWGNNNCSAPAPTGAGGMYVVSGPAGPYVLEAEASGYQSLFSAIILVSGRTVPVPDLLLIAIGPGGQYEVSGDVTVEAGSGPGLLGAIVTATSGVSTPVNANGSFSMTLAWGNYTLAANDPGYLTQTRFVQVAGPVSGVDFALPVATFTVSGVVRDGLTGLPLEGVILLENGGPLGTSGADGSYSIALANGTHDLVAQGPPQYASLQLVVTVSGSAETEPLTLYPPSVDVNGLVVNGLTGIPLEGASVTVTGNTSEGTSWTLNVVTGADGRFVVIAYPGAYTAVAQMGGFASNQSALLLNSSVSVVPLTLTLEPATATGPASAPPLLWGIVGLVGTGVIVVVVLLVVRRRASPRSPPPAAGPWEDAEAEELREPPA
jgi:hypothetical protein